MQSLKAVGTKCVYLMLYSCGFAFALALISPKSTEEECNYQLVIQDIPAFVIFSCRNLSMEVYDYVDIVSF